MWTRLLLAAVAIVATPPGDWFLDGFTGSGTLDTHDPEVGGAYTSDGGALTDMLLIGTPSTTLDDTFTISGSVFNDTFTGSGALTSHTSDSGHSWTDGNGNLSLSGGYLVCANGTTSSGRSIVATSLPFVATINIDVTFSGTSTSQLQFQSHWDFTGDNSSVLLTMVVNSSATTLRMILNLGSNVIDHTSTITSGAHSLVLNVAATSQSLTLDGISVGSSSTNISAYAGGAVGLTFSNFNPQLTKVDSVSISNGTQALSSHTADSGATWGNDLRASESNATAFILSGGAVTVPQNVAAMALASVSHGDYVIVDVDFIITSNGGSSSINVYLFDDNGSPATYYYGGVQFSSSGTLQWELQDSTGAFHTFSSSTGWVDGAHTMRIEMRDNVQRIYVDDVLKASRADDMTSFTGRHIELEISADVSHACQLAVDRITVTTIDVSSSGYLLLDAGGAYARSAAAPATTTYDLKWVFTLDDLTSSGNIDMALIDVAGGENWNLNPYLTWGSGAINLTPYFITSIANDSLPVIHLTSRFTTGTAHTLAAYVSSSGTIIYFDDTIVGALRGVPNTFDSVEFGIEGDGTMDYVQGTDGATAPDTVSVAGTYFFRDLFTGSAGALELHTPDAGHDYAEGAGLTLNGSGFIEPRVGGSDYAISYSGPTGTSYSIEVGFTVVDNTPTNTPSVEVDLFDPDTDADLIQLFLTYGPSWNRNVSVATTTGGTTYSNNDNPSVSAASHTWKASITPSGTTFYFDGASYATTSEKPDVAPLGVRFAIDDFAGADVKLDYVQGTND